MNTKLKPLELGFEIIPNDEAVYYHIKIDKLIIKLVWVDNGMSAGYSKNCLWTVWIKYPYNVNYEIPVTIRDCYNHEFANNFNPTQEGTRQMLGYITAFTRKKLIDNILLEL